MAALPRPTVTATTGGGGDSPLAEHVEVKIERDGKSQTVQGFGQTEAARARDAVERLLGDARTAEWLP